MITRDECEELKVPYLKNGMVLKLYQVKARLEQKDVARALGLTEKAGHRVLRRWLNDEAPMPPLLQMALIGAILTGRLPSTEDIE